MTTIVRTLPSANPVVLKRYHTLDDAQVFEHVQDTEPIMEHCAALRTENRDHGTKRKMRHVADIPVVLYESWRKEWRQKYRDFMKFHAFVAMKMNSREFDRFRVEDKASRLSTR